MRDMWGVRVRLASAAGAAFTLTPVPNRRRGTGTDGVGVGLDIELITPDRVVRYLAREPSASFTSSLADAWLACASEFRPEASVATVADEAAGLSMVVLQSTEREVTVEFSVVEELEAPVREYDVVSFEVARSALVSAAHELGRLAATTAPVVGWGD